MPVHLPTSRRCLPSLRQTDMRSRWKSPRRRLLRGSLSCCLVHGYADRPIAWVTPRGGDFCAHGARRLKVKVAGVARSVANKALLGFAAMARMDQPAWIGSQNRRKRFGR
jgi:hypothetical protein